MVMVKIGSLMEIHIKEPIRKENHMEKALIFGLMAINTKEISKMDLNRVKDIGRKTKVLKQDSPILSSKDLMKMTRRMDMEYIIGQVETFTKVTIKTMRGMVMER
jgi:homospermidine synthase